MCICEGEQQLSSTEDGRILIITLAASLGVPAVIVAVMLLNARFNHSPEIIVEEAQKSSRRSKSKKRRRFNAKRFN
ncbi:MAG: hypothetical protein BVN35_17820 [Proteobacteria bacterium ST_bin11]|nr:MAG: hypothetical protein BVN35_17820 [Proteobacteria bacterium ST_bin11]